VFLLIVWLIGQIDFINGELYSDRIAGFVVVTVLASFPAGLVVFEVLCSLGMRRCKFRNHPAKKPDWFHPDNPAADARQDTSRTDMS